MSMHIWQQIPHKNLLQKLKELWASKSPQSTCTHNTVYKVLTIVSQLLYSKSNSINILFSSHPLLIKNQTIITWQSHDYNHTHSLVLEELECLMGPDSDESFNWETLEGFQNIVDRTDPASHFMRTVYVMRLHTLPRLMEERGKKGKGEKGRRKEGK